MPDLYASNVDILASKFSSFNQLVREIQEEKEECKKYYELYKDTAKFDAAFYSDWHKDLYGYRPRKI